MKWFFLLAFLLILWVPHLRAQIDTSYHVLWLDNSDLRTLDGEGRVLDQLRDEGTIIYLEVRDGEDIVKFFHRSGKRYVSRRTRGGQFVSGGSNKLICPVELPRKVVTTFDPKTYDESKVLVQTCKLIPHGDWEFQLSEYQFVMGSYVDGFKHGRWSGVNNPSPTYEMGELVSVFVPDSSYLEQTIPWFFDQPMTARIHVDRVYESGTHRILSERTYCILTDQHKEPRVFEPEFKVTLLSNRTFRYQTVEDSQPDFLDRASGTGRWRIQPDGILHLQFENARIMVGTVSNVSKNRMLISPITVE